MIWRGHPRRALLVGTALAWTLLSIPPTAVHGAGVARGRPRLAASVCPSAASVASWSDARLAAQVIVVPAEESDLPAVDGEVAAGVGGVILFGDDAGPSLAPQLAALAAHAPGGLAPIVMADEEGGAVQSLAGIVGNVPSARQMGATMSPAAITSLAAGLGRAMRAAGVTMDLAPVLDVDGGAGPDDADADGTRSFSANAATAGADGVAFLRGLIAGGVVPVAKHFPGLGGATANTDVAPASTPPLAVLERVGLLPFARAIAAGVPAVMVSNAAVPGLSALPASVSSAVTTTLLERRLGFSGLVLTDALSAPSISGRGFSLSRAVVAALHAGADMVLFNADADALATTTDALRAALVQAVRLHTLTRARLVDAVRHIVMVRSRFALCG